MNRLAEEQKDRSLFRVWGPLDVILPTKHAASFVGRGRKNGSGVICRYVAIAVAHDINLHIAIPKCEDAECMLHGEAFCSTVPIGTA